MLWFVLLGIATGMRTMTPIAVLCWYAWWGHTPQHGWAFWTGNLISVIVFTIAALGEYVGDTLPSAPNRTASGPAAARLVFGGLVGALGASAVHQPVVGGVIFGMLGAAIGTWGGFRVRARLTKVCGRDLPAALLESLVALAFALWGVHALAKTVAQERHWWV